MIVVIRSWHMMKLAAIAAGISSPRYGEVAGLQFVSSSQAFLKSLQVHYNPKAPADFQARYIKRRGISRR